MGKTASPYCLYEKEDVIDDTEHTAFVCARWHGYRSVPIMMIASRENLTSVADSKTEKERS